MPLAAALAAAAVLPAFAPAAPAAVGPERVIGRETATGGHLNGVHVSRRLELPTVLRYRAETRSGDPMLVVAEIVCPRAGGSGEVLIRSRRQVARRRATGTVRMPAAGWDRDRPCRVAVAAGFRNSATGRGWERLKRRRMTLTAWSRSAAPEARVPALPWRGRQVEWDRPGALDLEPPAAQVGRPVEVDHPTGLREAFRGRPTLRLTPRWQRCDGSGASCADLPVTGWRYVPAPEDAGARLRVVVTAANGDGAVSAPTVLTAPVSAVDE
jgi:hypothetical protein